VARLGDVLSLTLEANDPNTNLGRPAKQAAETQRLAAPMLKHTNALASQLERAWPTLPTAKQRQLFAETQKMRQMLAQHHRRTRRFIKIAQLAVIRRVHGSRSNCSGGRIRAPRPKPVRRRGSRRVTSRTRAGLEAGDLSLPGLAPR
jgi:hypothetical protein